MKLALLSLTLLLATLPSTQAQVGLLGTCQTDDDCKGDAPCSTVVSVNPLVLESCEGRVICICGGQADIKACETATDCNGEQQCVVPPLTSVSVCVSCDAIGFKRIVDAGPCAPPEDTPTPAPVETPPVVDPAVATPTPAVEEPIVEPTVTPTVAAVPTSTPAVEPGTVTETPPPGESPQVNTRDPTIDGGVIPGPGVSDAPSTGEDGTGPDGTGSEGDEPTEGVVTDDESATTDPSPAEVSDDPTTDDGTTDDGSTGGDTGSDGTEGTESDDAEPTPDPICVDAAALAHLDARDLVFDTHRRAAVLCDTMGSCATPGHMVHFSGRAMMMRTYCQQAVGGCSRTVKEVNSPKFKRALRVPSRTEGLSYTTFAARFETVAEEHVLKTLVHIGL